MEDLGAGALAFALVVFVNVLNPEAFIVRHNVAAARAERRAPPVLCPSRRLTDAGQSRPPRPAGDVWQSGRARARLPTTAAHDTAGDEACGSR
jgi:hypothetical protein